MAVVGIDAHKRSHTFVAIDDSGRKIGQKVSDTNSLGHLAAIRWARSRFGADITWAVEDCRNVSRLLEQDLLAAGYTVIRVPTRLMARTRASARTVGKSDPIDALAIARAALREPNLPTAYTDQTSRNLKLLVDRREDLIHQRNATTCRLLWRLHELDPDRIIEPKALSSRVNRDTTASWLTGQQGLVAEIARDELADIDRQSEDARALEKRIQDLVEQAAPRLLAVPGCGPLSAAKIVAETAGVQRFPTEAAFARFAGVAPSPAWSGSTRGRWRYVKTGNRQVNAALHRIALTQIRRDGAARAYYRERIEAGEPPMPALRRLKRRLARVVYSRLRADALSQPTRLGPVS
ncbi:transposase [Mycobacterium sp. GA-1285]|nr:IS110 family transposase [Mycobacterium sp. GA-1285]KUI16990.1 transposase [Mycobacterium sp. GA-1285]